MTVLTQRGKETAGVGLQLVGIVPRDYCVLWHEIHAQFRGPKFRLYDRLCGKCCIYDPLRKETI